MGGESGWKWSKSNKMSNKIEKKRTIYGRKWLQMPVVYAKLCAVIQEAGEMGFH